VLDKAEYKAISHQAVRVIGRDVILAMSTAQRGLLNCALTRIIERTGSASKITDAEIEGQYEMIVEHVLPTGSHEHLL
jgi:hypothetical protein